MRYLLTFVLFCACAHAQVWNVAAGNDTLLGADGATVHCFRCYFANHEASFSLGYLNGHVVGAFSDQITLHSWVFKAGDFPVNFVLPTDASSNGLQLYFRGASVTHKYKHSQVSILGGLTTNTLQLPFLIAAQNSMPTGALLYERDLSSKLTLYSTEVISNRITAIQSLQWKPISSLTLGAAAGVGYSNPFAAVSAEHFSKRTHLKLNYQRAGKFYQLAQTPLVTFQSQPHGFNGLFEVHPLRNWNVSVQHQDFVYALGNNVLMNKTDSLSTYGRFSIFTGNASVYRGTSNMSRTQTGETFGLSARVGVIEAGVNEYLSSFNRTSVASITEHVTRKFSVTQNLTASAGQKPQPSFGGSYNGNKFSASVGTSMVFLPTSARSPWQSVFTAGVSFKLPRFSTVSADFVSALGHRNFSTGGNTWAYGSHGTNSLGEAPAHRSPGKYVVNGECKTADGEPLAGCAVRIGNEIVYSGADGGFTLHQKRSRELAVAVATDEFLAPGTWRIVSAPSTAVPDQVVEIVLSRQ